MGLYWCTNEKCATRGVYESDTGACPDCKAHLGRSIIAVHYLVPAGSDGPIRTKLGHRMIACDPNLTVLPQCSAERGPAVTCPKCRASSIYLEDEKDQVDNHVRFFEEQAEASLKPKGA